jgi:hypothetical protein
VSPTALDAPAPARRPSHHPREPIVSLEACLPAHLRGPDTTVTDIRDGLMRLACGFGR